MTNTTTDAAEARAREALAQACENAGLRASSQSIRKGQWPAVGSHPAVRAMLAFATAEAASGAGEREDEVQRLKAEVNRWRRKLWVIACHATGGGMPDIEGIDQSTNDISVQITASRNAIYQAGKDAALASLPPATDPAMVTVPRGPTEAMWEAFDIYNGDKRTGYDTWLKAWSAMLAAAPTIPATGEAVPEGMKPWHGGDVAPADWDGGPVLYRGWDGYRGDIGRWVKADLPTDIIAYTPKATIPATGHAATEGEGA